MRIKKWEILTIIIISLIVSTNLSSNFLIFLSSNAKEIDSSDDANNSLELQINGILYDLSSLNDRQDNGIEFIVKWKDFKVSRDIEHFITDYDIEIVEDLPLINSSLISVPIDFNKENIKKFILDMQLNPEISYLEPNLYDDLSYVPNDFYYSIYQWDLPLIGMESAWDTQLGSHAVYVAVIDSGIDYSHPDISGNYVPLGYDWVNDDNDPMDDRGHGTHCAGTIAATINNEIGVAGMAQVSIFAEKCLDNQGSGSHADFKSAVVHAVDNGADIISYSAGGSDSITKQEGVDYAISHGVMFIAAAGNEGNNIEFYPAAYPEVIAVSATDQNDQLASFSNYGNWIDVAAPGVDIVSTYLGGSYAIYDGTSMATPHVSGLAALIKSQFPSYTSIQIEQLIYEYAADLGDPGFDQYFGNGRIDATSIFLINAPPDSPTNPIPQNSATGISTNPMLSVDVSDPDGDEMDVSFYDASDDNLIGTDLNIPDGETASVIWQELSESTTYQWYVIADDGTETTQSPTWSFTTLESSENVIFLDTFNESILNPVWIWSPSESSYSLTTYPNRFSMEVAPNEDTWGGSFDSPRLYQNIPSGNLTMETFIQTNAGVYAQTGLLFFEDTSNWLVWGYVYDTEPDNHNEPGIGLEGIESGNPREELYFDPISSEEWNEGVYLRIEYTDFNDTFRFYYKKVGAPSFNWMGSRVIDWNDLKIGLWGKSWGSNPGYYSNFDYFLISRSPIDNERPNAPINPSPSDGAISLSDSPMLMVDVFDPNGDIMDVSFYDSSDNSLIGTDTDIQDGGTASLSWSGLSPGNIYSWYVIANDGIATCVSSIWSFSVGDTDSIFEDDFETYTVGTFPYNYELIYDGAGSNYQKITDDYSVSGSQSFTLTGASSWSAVATREFNYDMNHLFLEAQIMSETPSGSTGGNDNNIQVGFWNPDVATWGEYYVLINLRNDGKITLEGGTSVLVLGDYNAFTWYEVKLIVDLEENSVEAYINGALLAETSLVRDSTKTTDVAICSGWKGITGYIDDLKVSECNIADLPDLRDRGPSYSGWLRPGFGDLDIWCDIENVGTNVANSFNVSYYLSLDTSITAMDYLLGYDIITSLEKGDWTDSNWFGPVPTSIPDGEYYVGWIIDENNAVAELNETNNIFCIKTALVYVDYMAPSSDLSYIPDFSPNFVLSTTSISISADDGSGSGIDKIWYRIDGESWVEYVDAFTLSGYGEGLHTIEYYSIDEAGNIESINSEDIYLDVSGSSSLLTYSPNYSPNYVLATTSISISADDGSGSGIDEILYRIDGESWVEYVDAFTLSGYGEGLHTIEYYSIDNVGHVESTNSEEVYLDISAPSSLLSYNPDYSPNYVLSTTSISISADDGSGSGMGEIWFRIDGGSWVEYSGAFTLNGYGEGLHTIEYYSIDNVGHVESTNSENIYLDITEPTSSLSYIPHYSPNYIIDITTFSLSADDGSGSSIDKIWYRIDEGSWVEYIETFILSNYGEGLHTIEYYSVDNVGHAETINGGDIYMDPSEPTSSLSYIPHYSPNYIIDTTTFSLSADDGLGSGIDEIWYRIDGGSWVEYVDAFT
ncbi:MAG: hypothetical protein EU549_00805, partial [Promethearchaeota archaeon]